MSIEDCPDCRKLQSECEALERELATAQSLGRAFRAACRQAERERDELRRRHYLIPDPRAPKPVYVPAAVPAAQPRKHVDCYCEICDREHER